MQIKIDIEKFNAEKNGAKSSFYFSEKLKDIEKKIGVYTLRDGENVPIWTFSSKHQHFVAEVGFDKNGNYFSKLIRYPKNIQIETLTDFNDFCVKVIAVFLDKGFVLPGRSDNNA